MFQIVQYLHIIIWIQEYLNFYTIRNIKYLPIAK